MTILNNTSDGLHPELIVLFRTVAYLGKVNADDLLQICFPDIISDTSTPTRLRGALLRWTQLGLFTEKDNCISLDDRFAKSKKEDLDSFTAKLPTFCRSLILEEKNAFPFWGESAAPAGDFVRGITWLLAQDLYMLPTTWSGGAENHEKVQITGDKKIVQNDTRWTNLRFWARYLGFASGDSASFQIDPTVAIRDELPLIFGTQHELSANDFLTALSTQLPIFDKGVYRSEIESNLNTTTWRKPSDGHLSISLSFALRRLDLNGEIKLKGRADAGSSLRLTGRMYRTWIGFESVVWNGVHA
ncbi:hypothetical protein U737_15190 [Methylomonas sp. LW13]|uniref:protein DpdG n=1 Tax=unclassified Methylomonas TaxID=2608980 RepID=UPI00068984F1|nr:protein DpdG [Methylomonas sp. LW13]QBC28133.1 hypothetical protein U737_15190 [Methylomonas sp. LW13]